MNRHIKWTFQLILFLAGGKGFSQNQDIQMFVSQPYPLELTTAKTTHLVFPYDIISVDKGSRDILAQKAKGTSNILQVKAGKTDFQQSSLTVITADRKLYSFTVDYAAEPLQLTIEFSHGSLSQGASLEDFRQSQAELQQLSKRALNQPKRVHGVKDRSFQSALSLMGIYTHQDAIFYQLEITNNSQVSYEIGSVRFFICDKRRVKRTAVQQTEIKPLYIKGDTSVVAGKSTHLFVYALPKFTTADKKYLTIEVMEKNGGRNLRLGISNKTIVRARPLSD